MIVNKEDEIRELKNDVWDCYKTLEKVCMHICDFFEFEYMDIGIDGCSLEIMCRTGTKDIKKIKKIVEPYGFNVVYSYCFPSQDVTIEYDLIKLLLDEYKASGRLNDDL